MQIQLLIILILICIFNYMIYRGDWIAPALIFSFSFLACVICACINSNKWKLDLSYETFKVILLGVFMFCLGTFVVMIVMRKTNNYISDIKDVQPVNISDFILLIFLIFQALVRIIQFYIMVRNVGVGSMATIISTYHNWDINHKLIVTSPIADIGNIICNSAGYILMYIFVSNIFLRRKNSILLVLNLAVCLLGSMLGGFRTDMFAILIAGVADYFILNNRKNSWRGSASKRALFTIIVLFVIVVISFKKVGMMLGRGADIDYSDYIFTYIGAQIKNLDIFLNGKIKKSTVWGQNTLLQLYGVIDGWFGTSYSYTGNDYHELYNFVGRHPLGNVYTTFRPFYLDFGLKGVMIISFLIGAISQLVYGKTVYKKKRTVGVDYTVIMYSYMFFAIALLFFSNKFFEMVISIRLVYYGIGMLLCDILFFKIRFRNDGIVIRIKGE